MRKFCLNLFFILALFILIVSISNALSINVDPSSLVLSAKKGESISGFITIDNKGPQDILVKAYVEDWVFLPDRSKAFKKPGSQKNSCSQWITLYPDKFTIAPNRSQQVKYTITVPSDAKGGYYSVIFFESQHDDPDLLKKANVIIAGRIGTIVYFETKENSEKKLSLKDFSFSKPITGKPMLFKIKLKNDGNTFASPTGNIIIVDSLSNLLAKIDLGKQFILQGEEVTVEKKWICDLPKGEYEVILTLDYGTQSPISARKKIKVNI